MKKVHEYQNIYQNTIIQLKYLQISWRYLHVDIEIKDIEYGTKGKPKKMQKQPRQRRVMLLRTLLNTQEELWSVCFI